MCRHNMVVDMRFTLLTLVLELLGFRLDSLLLQLKLCVVCHIKRGLVPLASNM